MQVLCPNCKASADLVTIDSAEFIQCPECGWFETQGDGSLCPCDPPQSSADRGEVSEPEPEQDHNTPSNYFLDNPAEVESGTGPETPASPVPDMPDDNEDDPDEVTVTLNFED